MTESAAQNENQAAAAAAPEQDQAQAQPQEAQAQEPAPEKSAEDILREQLDAAEKKIAENYDLYVRAMADLENTRRRADADVLKAHKFAVEKFAKALLPVADSFEKAIEHAAGEEGPMKEGLVSTYRQLVHALEVSGMKQFDPKGEAFDPNFHQAVSMKPAAEGEKPGTVAIVVQKGWMLQDRVLRPAMVIVAQG